MVPLGHDESLGVLHVFSRFVVKAVRAPEELQFTARGITKMKRIAPSEALIRLAVGINVRRR